MGLGATEGGQNLPFSIDFDCCPYNTLAQPCQSVIFYQKTQCKQLSCRHARDRRRQAVRGAMRYGINAFLEILV